jgi:enoyl-CoA hydratase/carnithine racemase
VPVITVEWDPGRDPTEQLAELSEAVAEPGFLVIRFAEVPAGEPLPWPALEPWTSSRAVTVADVAADLEAPALELALCSDLVYLRDGVQLGFPDGDRRPSAGLVWAWGRAGRAALNRCLLRGGAMAASEAVELGLAAAVIAADAHLPLPVPHSPAAVTIARDLLRATSAEGRGSALELAAFRLLFAIGDPEEGARAFLDGREPHFD